MRFAEINLILKSERMTDLIERIGLAGDALLNHFLHAPEIAIEEVDVIALDEQPAAAIHSRAPCTDRRHQFIGMAIVEFARRLRKFRDRKEMVAVVGESEIDVRIGARGSARPRAAKRDRLDAVDLAQSRRHSLADRGYVRWDIIHITSLAGLPGKSTSLHETRN